MIVLDTNVLSELMRPVPNPAVNLWFTAQASDALFVTTVTEAEIRLGLALMPRGRRRQDLELRADIMFGRVLTDNMLPFDSSAAGHYASICARRRALGRPIAMADAMIAAIAAAHGFAVATRDVAGFADSGVVVVDPLVGP